MEFGLIGKKLGHSFSKAYFTKKFEQEGIDASFENFELNEIDEFPALLKSHPALKGLSVTIPWKTQIIPLLDELDDTAAEIGAVNCVHIHEGKTRGCNTDAEGFSRSLRSFYHGPANGNALILGTGGASKAVQYTLRRDFHFEKITFVSRSVQEQGVLTYEELKHASLRGWHLIVNTTPAGMWPDVQGCPDISFSSLSAGNYLFDLVYNPEETVFMKLGKAKGCAVKNGLEMLHLQAEAAWKLWNS